MELYSSGCFMADGLKEIDGPIGTVVVSIRSESEDSYASHLLCDGFGRILMELPLLICGDVG